MDFLNLAWFGILIWALVFVIALIVELIEPQLVSIWFALASFITLLVQTIFSLPFFFQVIIFILTSALELYLSRPIYQQFIKKQKTTLTNAASMIGKDIKILTTCDKANPGKGLFGDVQWTIITDEDTRFKTNDIATITALKGNKAIIKRKVG